MYPDGTERPIAYASRTLTPSERNYGKRSSLSGVWHTEVPSIPLWSGVSAVYKPQTIILGPKTGIPSLAAARLQRWALILSAYKYQIQFRPTKAHGNANGLSRLPLKNGMGSVSIGAHFHYLSDGCFTSDLKADSRSYSLSPNFVPCAALHKSWLTCSVEGTNHTALLVQKA